MPASERVEDQRILTGQGHYIDDLQLPGMLHAAFLRSPFAHARITSIDASPALTAPGVVAVYTGEDLRPLSKPIKGTLQLGEYPETYPLATDKVLYVGDLVAMVVAESRYLAEDALELIEVEYDPLPAVMDYEAALDPSIPPLFRDFESNLLGTTTTTGGDVDAAFADADRVIDVTLAPAPDRQRSDGNPRRRSRFRRTDSVSSPTTPRTRVPTGYGCNWRRRSTFRSIAFASSPATSAALSG